MQIAFLLDLRKEDEPTTHQKGLKIKLESRCPCFHEETQQGWDDGCTSEKWRCLLAQSLEAVPKFKFQSLLE